jgi:hypothetical protein
VEEVADGCRFKKGSNKVSRFSTARRRRRRISLLAYSFACLGAKEMNDNTTILSILPYI